MDRRTFLGAAGGAALAGVAGCITRDDDEPPEEDGTLRVATYSSMVDEDADPAGAWIKEHFEEEHEDVELDWTVPEDGLNHYVQQAERDAVDADVYLGVNVDDLVQVDDALDEQLFEPIDRGQIERVDRIRDDLEFGDPHDRVLPFDTGYISLVYDESEVEEPESFEDLLDEEYEDALITQNAQYSDPGQAFLLWTIAEYGEDGYLDYWRDLQENGVRVIDDWSESYFGPYMEGERPMIVSYSTDQVFQVAEDPDADLTRHQIAFPNGQGYENPEGVAIFAETTMAEEAHQFVDFLLSSEAQAEIAVRNVQFPAVSDEHVDLDESFAQHAFEPEEPVTLTYEDLQGSLDGWVNDWAREIVE